MLRNIEWWEKFWDKKSNSYGDPNINFLEFAKNYFNENNGNLTAIDIASGNGRYAIELSKIGYETDALEYAKSGVLRIQNYAKREKINVNSFQGDYTNLCFEKRDYDLVLSSGLLEEIDMKHHTNVIKGYQSWTKVGGLNMIKYCLEIAGRGQLVKDNFVNQYYNNDNWKILLFKEKEKLNTSKANIDFDENMDSEIRTGTLIAVKIK